MKMLASEISAPLIETVEAQADRVAPSYDALLVTVTEALKTGALNVLDARLAALYYANSAQAEEMSAFVDSVTHFNGALKDGGKLVLIDATAAAGDGAALLAELQALGLQGGSSFRGMASGYLPVSAIGDLGSLAHITTARESGVTTNVGAVTTQADATMYATGARSTYGVTGSGVKVGVISDSFNTSNTVIGGTLVDFARDVATGDLKPTTRVLQDYPGGTDEGRGMAQLVQDLAPGADITFATAYNGQAGFANNILALAAAGNKIIVDDVAYFAELYYQNGPIAQAINQAAEQYGVTYFSSAGNGGQEGWQGAWVNGATYTRGGVQYQLMSFGVPAGSTSGAAQDYLRILSGNGEPVVVQWDQPGASAGGPGSQVDVDVFLTNAAGTTEYEAAVTNNLNGDPVEIVGGYTGDYLRVGVRVGSAVPTNLRVIYYGTNLETTSTNTNEGTAQGHASAKGAIGVGAVPYYATPVNTDTARLNQTGQGVGQGIAGYTIPAHESFSTRGVATYYFDDDGVRYTTPIVRSAAQIAAVDGGNTTFFYGDDADSDSFYNFYGTSAAAPDAAAVAALMLSADPTLTSADILALLQATAIDMDDRYTTGFDAGFDTRSGAGFIDAQAAVRAVVDRVINIGTQPITTGSSRGETINGTAGANIIAAAGGNDVVNAGAGVDVVYGNLGDDQLYGNQDNDTLFGNEGADKLFGGQGDDALYGGQGDDVLEGGLGNDAMNGGAGTDTVSYLGAPSAVSVTLVAVTEGSGSATGGAGTDVLINIENVLGSTFADILRGDATNNVLTGGLGADQLYGNDADDVLDGGEDDDGLFGGNGYDTASYASATAGVTVSLAVTTRQATGAAGSDLLNGIEQIVGSSFADVLTAVDGGTLRGGAGDDRLLAAAGVPATVDKPDVVRTPTSTTPINLSGAFDLTANPNITSSRTIPHATITATTGSTAQFDTYTVALAAGEQLIVDGDNANFDMVLTVKNSAGTQVATNDDGPGDPGDAAQYLSFINYTPTVAGTYTIQVGRYLSSTAPNTTLAASSTYLIHVSGAAQAVTYTGGLASGGNAFLYGEAGADTLESTAGDDLLDGGADIDTVSYAGVTSGVTVNLTVVGAQSTGGGGSDTLVGVENLIGSAYADTLTGDAGANVLTGGLGIDTLMGGFGADVLYGNQDNDVLYGNQDNDVLYGGQGADFLFGGQGDDVLAGGAGADQLQGNLGADRFLYLTAGDSTLTDSDFITGFETGIDKIDLRAVIAAAGGSYSYQINATSGDTTTLLVDLGANGSADVRIVLAGTGVLAAGDIFFT